MLKDRFLITQSLLSSWEYLYKAWDKKAAQQDFMRVLHREKTRPNQAMLDGIQFENMVTACCGGGPGRRKPINGARALLRLAISSRAASSRWRHTGTR